MKPDFDFIPHFRALGRVWLLYCTPIGFRSWFAAKRRKDQWITVVSLSLHSMPYVLLCYLAARFILEQLGEFKSSDAFEAVALGVVVGIAGRIAGRLIEGVDVNFDAAWERSAEWGAAVGILAGIILSIYFVASSEVVFTWLNAFVPCALCLVMAMLGAALFLFALVTLSVVLPIVSGSVGGSHMGTARTVVLGVVVGSGVGSAQGILLGSTAGLASAIAVARAYYFPIQLLFASSLMHTRYYSLHPVAWDSMCSLPSPRLGVLLADYAAVDRARADQEIDRLIDEYPSQRGQALQGRARLIARDCAAPRSRRAFFLREPIACWRLWLAGSDA